MATSVASGVGWLRIAVGLALIAAPGPLLRTSAGREGSGSMLVLARTVGVRDLVIGAGTISALRSGAVDDARRWVTVGVASDALDALVGAAGVSLMGRRGTAIATGSALPVLAAGLWARSALHAGAETPAPG